LIPRGFVMVTEDRVGPFDYSAEDYARAVRLGASFQSIRLTLGKLGGWPGYALDQEYLRKVQRMVHLGRESGLNTTFKMTVYDIKGFGEEKWAELWRNEHGEQDRLLAAWTVIWRAFKDDPSVFGYDLLNEPFKGYGTYEDLEANRLIPLYRRLIDALQAVSPAKWALYQPALLNKADQIPAKMHPFVEMKTPINRKHAIFAPHPYSKENLIEQQLDRFLKEAALSGVPVLAGEWGRPPKLLVDSDWDQQAIFQNMYTKTVEAFDKRMLGAIKPWFLGARERRDPDWGLFTDPGGRTAERKYLMDAIARPGPQAINGRIQHFGFNFATRVFTMEFEPDIRKMASTIYIPADRHYPDGFCLSYNDEIVLAFAPNGGARVLKASTGEGARQFHWDASTERLTVDAWPGISKTAVLRVFPGTTGSVGRTGN
jgi:hypothetical protein